MFLVPLHILDCTIIPIYNEEILKEYSEVLHSARFCFATDKYTTGEINSLTGYQGDVATYQISAPVTHGNSGGPMFDYYGNVIGIVNSGITDKEIAENVGYAIKIYYLKNLIERAGLNVTLPSYNTISTLSKQEKIKKLEKFVYYIECRK